MTRFPRLADFILFSFLIGLLFTEMTQAQFLTSPQPGDIYKEYPLAITSSAQWRITHSGTTRPDAQAHLPNRVLTISGVDKVDAVRAEFVIDFWGGHVGTPGSRFRFNGNSWIPIPALGAANGIPAGYLGICYISQYNPVVNIPISHIQSGTNTFERDCDNQVSSSICPGTFNWGQTGTFGVMLRVYYNSNKPHPTGSISSPSSNGVIGENPTITAATSGSVAQVDFLAYHDGVDYDGDGVYQEYHHSYHRPKGVSTFTIQNHAGTKTSAPYSVTWNTDLVPNQSGIKLKALIKGTNGVFFVTNEVTGLTLQRTGTVIICKPTNVPRKFWVRNNQAEMTSNFVIPAGTNLANVTSAKLAIATWNGVDGQREPGQTYYMRVNNYTLPSFGADHHYSWNAISIPANQLLVGTNTFRVRSQSSHHGIEILYPGPALVLRLSTGGGSVAPSITQHPSNQSVSVGQTATFTVQATGSPTLTYQWQKNNVNINNATSASYTTPATVSGDNGSTYRCIVTNAFGNPTSNSATLTVTEGPPPGANVIANPGFESGTTGWQFYTNGTGGFTSEPPGYQGNRAGKVSLATMGNNMQLYQINITLQANTNYTLSFAAYSSTGKDLAMALQKHTSPFTNYGINNIKVDVTNQWQIHTIQFTTTGFAGTVNDARLRFYFNGHAAAGETYYFDDIALQVTGSGPAAPTITTHPANQSVTVGQTATFSVVAAGTGLGYQWQKNNVNINNATNASYTTPATAIGDNGSTYRCVVSNAGGSVTSNRATLTVAPPMPVSWWNDAWPYRLPLDVNVGEYGRTDKPVEFPVHFTSFLRFYDRETSFDENSIRVIEVNATGAILDTAVLFQFDRDTAYNPASNAAGMLVFMPGGTTPQNGTRYFHVYFGVAGGGFSAPSFSPLVTYNDDVMWEGQNSYQITTPRAIYYYHKQGGGFASLIDNNGNDWISYRPSGGSAGHFRGIPNLGDVFHPGYTNSASTIKAQGPLRLTIQSTSLDNAWEGFWHIYPSYAHMTLTRKGANYWFLYEGTPGGTLDTATDFMYRSNGVRTKLATSWFGDLASPEWVYFGDATMRRSLFVIHHEDDAQPDYYRQMEGNMTVFGFGRQDPCCTRYMSAVPQNFTIGLAEDSAFTATSNIINSSYQPVGIIVGPLEIRPSNVPFVSLPGSVINKEIPTEFGIFQNYPNPFNPSTHIRYQLPRQAHAILRVYDVLGRTIATLVDEEREPGNYEITFDGSGLSSGIYVYRFEADGFVAVRRLTLLK